MTEFTKEWIAEQKKLLSSYTTEGVFENPNVDYSFELDILQRHYPEALDHIERLQQRIKELEIQLKSKDIIINNQQGRLNYYATKDLFGGNNE